MTRTEIENSIQELYIGILGRAADAAGLKYWADEIEAGTQILDNTRAAFTQQAEYTSIYGSLNSGELVTRVYQNMLGREPDTAGLEYWTSELDRQGPVTPDKFVLAVINAAKSSGNSDASVLSNKVEAAGHFTSTTSSKKQDAEFQALAKSAVNGVTADTATVTTAKSSVDSGLSKLGGERPAQGNYDLDNFLGQDGQFSQQTLTVTDGDQRVIADREVSEGTHWQYDIKNFGLGDTLSLGNNILPNFDGSLPLDGQDGSSVSSLLNSGMDAAASVTADDNRGNYLLTDSERDTLAGKLDLFLDQRGNQIDVSLGDAGANGRSVEIDVHYTEKGRFIDSVDNVSSMPRINLSFGVDNLYITDAELSTLGIEQRHFELLRNPADGGGLVEKTHGDAADGVQLLGFVAAHGVFEFMS